MSLSDPISDLLTRLRNGQIRMHKVVTSPYSKMRENVLRVLKDEGYIRGFKVIAGEVHKSLSVELKYYEGKAVMQSIKKISKPGRRVYSGVSDLPKIHNGLGTILLSTSHGIMSDEQARQKNVGGEIICSVY